MRYFKSLAHILDKIGRLLAAGKLLESIVAAFSRRSVFQLLFREVPFVAVAGVSHLRAIVTVSAVRRIAAAVVAVVAVLNLI